MSILSTIFGSRISAVPNLFAVKATTPWSSRNNNGGVLVIVCSSRPTKKATAHHMKTRPRKTRAYDIRRKPTVYAPLPPLPPDWLPVTFESSEEPEAGGTTEAAAVEEAVSPPHLPLPSDAPSTT